MDVVDRREVVAEEAVALLHVDKETHLCTHIETYKTMSVAVHELYASDELTQRNTHSRCVEFFQALRVDTVAAPHTVHQPQSVREC